MPILLCFAAFIAFPPGRYLSQAAAAGSCDAEAAQEQLPAAGKAAGGLAIEVVACHPGAGKQVWPAPAEAQSWA